MLTAESSSKGLKSLGGRNDRLLRGAGKRNQDDDLVHLSWSPKVQRIIFGADNYESDSTCRVTIMLQFTGRWALIGSMLNALSL